MRVCTYAYTYIYILCVRVFVCMYLSYTCYKSTSRRSTGAQTTADRVGTSRRSDWRHQATAPRRPHSRGFAITLRNKWDKALIFHGQSARGRNARLNICFIKPCDGYKSQHTCRQYWSLYINRKNFVLPKKKFNYFYELQGNNLN